MQAQGYGWSSWNSCKGNCETGLLSECSFKLPVSQLPPIDYVGEGEAEGLTDGSAAFSSEALMAFSKTMEVYLLSSE